MNRFWLGLLILTWRTFQSVEGAKDECPSPLVVEFAEFFAESYKVGTQVKYKCDKGYKRPSGQGWKIKCNSDQDGFGQWTTVACIVDPNLPLPPSTQPTTQTGEVSGKTDGPLTTPQPPMKDSCGALKLPKHIKAVSTTYMVGQQLRYRCMDGYQAGRLVSGKSTCRNANGRTVWSKLRLRCTNNSTSIEEDIAPETGTTDIPSYEDCKDYENMPDVFSYDYSAAGVIYPALAALFAIAMMALVVI